MTATLTRVDVEPTATAVEPFVLTAEHLRALGACATYQGMFRRSFPRGVELTEERCVRHAIKWEVAWLASLALNFVGYERWVKTCNDANARYSTTLARAHERYLPSHIRQSNEFGSAYARYQRASVRAGNRYRRELAAAFARLLPDYPNARFVRIVRGGNRG